MSGKLDRERWEGRRKRGGAPGTARSNPILPDRSLARVVDLLLTEEVEEVEAREVDVLDTVDGERGAALRRDNLLFAGDGEIAEVARDEGLGLPRLAQLIHLLQGEGAQSENAGILIGKGHEVAQ